MPALLALPALAQGSDALSRIRRAGVVRIAMDLGAPPFGFMDGQMRPTGSEVDTADLLVADLGARLERVSVTSANRVPFLLTDRADLVVSVFGITDERRRVIDFSIPYAAVGAIVAGPLGEAAPNFAALVGKRVGATRGTTNDQELTRGAVRGTEIVRFEDDATLITAVASGQVDWFVTAPPLVPQINQRRPARPVEIKFTMRNFPYGVGLKQGEPALKAWLDGVGAQQRAQRQAGGDQPALARHGPAARGNRGGRLNGQRRTDRRRLARAGAGPGRRAGRAGLAGDGAPRAVLRRS